jgi:predicted nucleic acid-binding protein
MIVVSDTSPLNYLVIIGRHELLHQLFGQVIIPSAVAAELRHCGAPAIVRHWLASPPAWLQIVSAIRVEDSLAQLGAGEAEAITLAQRLKADILLCDDAEARPAAAARGLKVTGTLGLLEAGSIKGLLDLPTAIQQLRNTTLNPRSDCIANAR